MWISTPTSFVSIVAHRTQRDHLLVRARLKGDIQRLFPKASVQETPAADYRFRAVVSRRVAAGVIADAVAGISYPNVKDAIPHRGKVHQLRHDAMMRTWTIWNQAQGANVAGRSRLNAAASDSLPHFDRFDHEGRYEADVD